VYINLTQIQQFAEVPAIFGQLTAISYAAASRNIAWNMKQSMHLGGFVNNVLLSSAMAYI
jgi:hypothetical protein